MRMETKYCGTDGVDAVCAITDDDKMIFHYHATLTVYYAVTVSAYQPPNLTSFARILYIVCCLKTFTSYYMFYTLHDVEPLRYDSVRMNEKMTFY